MMDEEYCFETGHVCATHHSFPVPALNMAYVLSLIATSMVEIAGRLLEIYLVALWMSLVARYR